jgi:hypothetical protein
MSTLNVLVSHLPAAYVDEQLELLRAACPTSTFAVAYGGARPEFDAIADDAKALVADRTLGGPPRSLQSYTTLLGIVRDRWLARDATLDAVYLFEYDHLILRPDFERELRELAARTGAAMMGKNCTERNGTNWHHYTRFRRDPELLAHLRAITTRSRPDRLFGTLGDGIWLTAQAVESYLSLPRHPPCYGELYVPTILHHLGHEVVDIDAHSSLYEAVRWEPEVDAAELAGLQRRGAMFAHPVKDADTRRLTLRALAAQSRSEARLSG